MEIEHEVDVTIEHNNDLLIPMNNKQSYQPLLTNNNQIINLV